MTAHAATCGCWRWAEASGPERLNARCITSMSPPPRRLCWESAPEKWLDSPRTRFCNAVSKNVAGDGCLDRKRLLRSSAGHLLDVFLRSDSGVGAAISSRAKLSSRFEASLIALKKCSTLALVFLVFSSATLSELGFMGLLGFLDAQLKHSNHPNNPVKHLIPQTASNGGRDASS